MIYHLSPSAPNQCRNRPSGLHSVSDIMIVHLLFYLHSKVIRLKLSPKFVHLSPIEQQFAIFVQGIEDFLCDSLEASKL